MPSIMKGTLIMQNLLNLISILAFIMSSITWFCTALNRSIKFSVEVKDYAKYKKSVQFYLYMQNNSGKPITISGLAIVYKNQKFPCKMLPSVLRDKDQKPLVTTPLLPVNFAPHQGLCHAFEFSHCPDIELAPGKTVDFEIYTNRKVLKRSVILGNGTRFSICK